MSAEITRGEWLKALGDSVAPADPEALTTRELAQMFGVSPSSIKERLRQLLDEHKATRTFKRVTDGAGRAQRVPAYKLVKPAKGKRR